MSDTPGGLFGFFSYAREEEPDGVDTLFRFFQSEVNAAVSRRNPVRVYRDILSNSPGEYWERRIALELGRACCFCWVQTPHWFESELCQTEFEAFDAHLARLAQRLSMTPFELSELTITPVRFRDGCDGLAGTRLSHSLYHRLHADLTHPFFPTPKPAAFNAACKSVGERAGIQLQTLIKQVGGVEVLLAACAEDGDFLAHWETRITSTRSPRAAPRQRASALGDQLRLAAQWNGGAVTRAGGGLVLAASADGALVFFVTRKPLYGRRWFSKAELERVGPDIESTGLALPGAQQAAVIRRLMDLSPDERLQLQAPDPAPFWMLSDDGALVVVGEGDHGALLLVEDA